jgi:hypothetical protein
MGKWYATCGEVAFSDIGFTIVLAFIWSGPASGFESALA